MRCQYSLDDKESSDGVKWYGSGLSLWIVLDSADIKKFLDDVSELVEKKSSEKLGILKTLNHVHDNQSSWKS